MRGPESPPSRAPAPVSNEDVLSWSATELSDAIQKERTLTCVALMEATLNRIDAINPRCNAIILMRGRDELLDEARAMDAELMLPPQATVVARGWLHGIPTAIKDLSNVRGIPTTMGGSPLCCGSGGGGWGGQFTIPPPPARSDIYAENMVRDGAIVLGKTNTPEGGIGSNTYNRVWGATANPFDTTRTSGGSSGGAAVAVAAGMLSFADGTDNMGSLRNPAGWNGVYSHRPTAGLVREGGGDGTTAGGAAARRVMSHPAATPGPVARTPLDCARLLQTMVGETDKFDASSLVRGGTGVETSRPPPDAPPVVLPRRTRRRIGWLGDWQGRLPFEDHVLAQCREALEAWSTASSCDDDDSDVIDICVIHERVELFPLEKLWEAYNAVRFRSTWEKYSDRTASSHDGGIDAGLGKGTGGTALKEELAWEIEQGRSVTEADLDRAKTVHQEYMEWLGEVFDGHDVDALALPTAQVWPFPIGWRYPETIAGTRMDTYHRWMEVCVPVSFGGLPCTTVPAGFRRNGGPDGPPPLPMGIQLLANRGQDLKVLSLAMSYHKFTDIPSRVSLSESATSSSAVILQVRPAPASTSLPRKLNESCLPDTHGWNSSACGQNDPT